MDWPWYIVVPLWMIAIGTLAISNHFNKILEVFDNESKKMVDDAVDRLVDEKIESWSKK